MLITSGAPLFQNHNDLFNKSTTSPSTTILDLPVEVAAQIGYETVKGAKTKDEAANNLHKLCLWIAYTVLSQDSTLPPPVKRFIGGTLIETFHKVIQEGNIPIAHFVGYSPLAACRFYEKFHVKLLDFSHTPNSQKVEKLLEDGRWTTIALNLKSCKSLRKLKNKIKKNPELKSFSIHKSQSISLKNICSLLRSLPNLSEFGLHGTTIPPKEIGKTKQLSNLIRSISYDSAFSPKDEDLNRLWALEKLESVSIDLCTALDFRKVNRVPKHIKSLHLFNCTGLSDGKMGFLKDSQLTSLTLTSAQISSSGLTDVNPASLTHLNLSYCQSIDDQTLKYFEKSSLHTLNVDGTRVTSQGIVPFKELHSLSMKGCQTDESTIQDIAALPLHHLGITIDDENLKHFSSMTTLRSLDLSLSTDLTIEGLRAIAHLPIESLDLTGCPHIDDNCLGVISKMPRLKKLSLRANATITDKGLAAFKKSTTLERIDVRNCPRVKNIKILQEIPTLYKINK